VDWANEEYVRLYTRETADDLELSWEALALWRALLIRFDRAGIIPIKNGWISIARLVRMPLEVVQQTGPELVRDGRLRMVDGAALAPNFTEAQTTSKSDKSRQRESRDRRRLTTSQRPESIDTGHTLSQDVTPSHTASQNVTLSYAPLADTDPSPVVTPVSGKPDGVSEFAAVAIAEINRWSGHAYEPNSKSAINLAKALVKAKHTEADAIAVIQSKRHWLAKPDMRDHFCPSTLLGSSNFQKYLDDLKGKGRTQPPLNLTRPDEPETMFVNGKEYVIP
jgi:hypothetical protein